MLTLPGLAGAPASRRRRRGCGYNRVSASSLPDPQTFSSPWEPPVLVKKARMNVELAVLNEKLRGGEPHALRRTLEVAARKNRNWQLLSHYVDTSVPTGGAVSLSLLEAAKAKLAEGMMQRKRDTMSVSDLVSQLEATQAEAAFARGRVRETEARVDANLERVRALESAERSAAARARDAQLAAASPSSASLAAAAAVAESSATAAVREEVEAEEAEEAAYEAASAALRLPHHPQPQRKGLDGRFADAGSLASPSSSSRLAHFWHPLTFLSKAVDGEEVVAFGRALRVCRSPASACGWKVLALDDGCDAAVGTTVAQPRELPTAAVDGLLAFWPGDSPPRSPPQPGALAPPSASYTIHAEIVVEDVPVEHGLLLENLLDLAHAPFTHTSTFARGWRVPDLVKFAASSARGGGGGGWADAATWLAAGIGARGSWAPYPIDMAFEPPCCVISHVGLAAPGAAGGGARFEANARPADCAKKLHQLHVCLPSLPGRTRLLYRMSLDFAPWARALPGMAAVWSEMASQVLGEDLRLVQGQQERMAAGARVWGHPVGYDACALAYRRFRNAASLPALGVSLSPAPAPAIVPAAAEGRGGAGGGAGGSRRGWGGDAEEEAEEARELLLLHQGA